MKAQNFLTPKVNTQSLNFVTQNRYYLENEGQATRGFANNHRWAAFRSAPL